MNNRWILVILISMLVLPSVSARGFFGDSLNLIMNPSRNGAVGFANAHWMGIIIMVVVLGALTRIKPSIRGVKKWKKKRKDKKEAIKKEEKRKKTLAYILENILNQKKELGNDIRELENKKYKISKSEHFGALINFINEDRYSKFISEIVPELMNKRSKEYDALSKEEGLLRDILAYNITLAERLVRLVKLEEYVIGIIANENWITGQIRVMYTKERFRPAMELFGRLTDIATSVRTSVLILFKAKEQEEKVGDEIIHMLDMEVGNRVKEAWLSEEIKDEKTFETVMAEDFQDYYVVERGLKEQIKVIEELLILANKEITREEVYEDITKPELLETMRGEWVNLEVPRDKVPMGVEINWKVEE